MGGPAIGQLPGLHQGGCQLDLRHSDPEEHLLAWMDDNRLRTRATTQMGGWSSIYVGWGLKCTQPASSVLSNDDLQVEAEESEEVA